MKDIAKDTKQEAQEKQNQIQTLIGRFYSEATA